MKFLTLGVAVAIFASTAYAETVRSKRGSIKLTANADGGDVVCEVPFGQGMEKLSVKGSQILVKAGCGQGWAAASSVEIVRGGQTDRAMNLETVDIVGWMDDPSAVIVLDQATAVDDGVNMNRNFNDMFRRTQDRERVEMRNGEN
jgi:hypothetical protein